ncbi:MAG: SUMF1/EgtB/PvdO family nonheme iron enzyme [Nitrospirae bacterium]|nr:SUMF1/EgtB/PvdO family nonheme iron enzyme [Nitrospirota bacterium]
MEHEWKYAARSGGKEEKWAGTSDELKLIEYAWYDKNSWNGIHPVGQKLPNGLGIYDMSGNVNEWVDDTEAENLYWEWADHTYVEVDYRIDRVRCEQHFVRGGCCYSNAKAVSCTYKHGFYSPEFRCDSIGFRLVLEKFIERGAS